jgi:hypothetical protein
VILGDLSIRGNIKPQRSLAESLQVAMDNGARTTLIPLENKRNFLATSWSELTQCSPIHPAPPNIGEAGSSEAAVLLVKGEGASVLSHKDLSG